MKPVKIKVWLWVSVTITRGEEKNSETAGCSGTTIIPAAQGLRRKDG